MDPTVVYRLASRGLPRLPFPLNVRIQQTAGTHAEAKVLLTPCSDLFASAPWPGRRRA
jgi:hypothetical protein